jgi:agmatinase
MMYEMIPDAKSSLFCSDASLNNCELVILPVPVDASASYGQGASRAPEAIRLASHQLDFFELEQRSIVSDSIFMMPVKSSWVQLNKVLTAQTGRYRLEPSEALRSQINALSQNLHKELKQSALDLLSEGRKIGLLGGDHSAPLGFIQAIDSLHPTFGILHIDAHHDLRESYEGFTDSHASIMHRVLSQCPHLKNLVSVGIRDFSMEEFQYAQRDPRIRTLYDNDLKNQLFSGDSWQNICGGIIESLPDKVYISLDIDGLTPVCCPHTGTPVPGGLSFHEVRYLLNQLRQSGKDIIGFDLCEVAPDMQNPEDTWDANVGARVLHMLCSVILQGHESVTP